MSEQIDWSKAPEGATHYFPSTEVWYMAGNGCAPLVWIGMWRKAFQFSQREHKCIERPTTPSWSGEGMPPVGVVCEIAASTEHLKISHPEGARVKVYATFTDDRGVELAAFVDELGMVAGVAIAKCFRPIRTAEQIAAEEREAGVAEMLGLFGGTDSRDTYLMQRLYDAGYRKP